MKNLCALLLTILLSMSHLCAGLVYDKKEQHLPRKITKKFDAIGQLQVIKKSGTTYGTGSLITIQGQPAILTGGHVIEGAKKLTFTLDIKGEKTAINLDLNQAHIYPLYTKLKDKIFDIAIIFLTPKQVTLKGKRLTITRLFGDPLSVRPLKPLFLDHEDVEDRYIRYAGYGTNGTFNNAGHIKYSNRAPQKTFSQMRVTPKKNILYEHGCGYDNTLDVTKEEIKGIAEKHFFWDREKIKNTPVPARAKHLPLGAFSPGDSGAPLLHKGRIIGVVATAELPLINMSAKDFYQFVPKDVRETWIGWDQGFSQGSFAQGVLRGFAQSYHNIPEATVNLYQTATALTPTIYQWMLTKAPK